VPFEPIVSLLGVEFGVPQDYKDLVGYGYDGIDLNLNLMKALPDESKVLQYVRFTYTLPPVTGYTDFGPEHTPISEDFADSAAWYVARPCELLQKSPERYTYFRDTIFVGREYIPPQGCGIQ